MKTPLALLNLVQERTRTLVAIGGVTFAVVLMLMQLGFFQSARLTATLIYDQLDFDLLLVSPDYQHIAFPGTIPLRRLQQAQAVSGVESATSLGIGGEMWSQPSPDGRPDVDPADTRRRRNIMLFGIDPDSPPFLLPAVRAEAHLLRMKENVLFDLRSRPEFGVREIGASTEVGGRRVRIAGHYSLGTGFGADGALIANWDDFRRITRLPSDRVQLGLVKLQAGADPEKVAAEIRALFPAGDVLVRTRDDAEGRERDYWVRKTSVGVIFACGVVVAFLVGTSIVYQVLANDISFRLSEYATLKAVGYSQWYLASVVLQQAVILAIAGFLPGWGAAWLGYRLTEAAARIPMRLDSILSLSVFGLTLLMCCTSGLLALRKLAAADPADLF